MKNIFKIHPLTYIFTLVFIVLGLFKFYLYFMIIIFIHELGHIIFSCIFKWRIKKIIILPMGALIKFDSTLNKPLKEEFLIAIMGVIFQTIFIYFFNNEYLVMCYKIILIFNLMPIYPLDGAKIMNLLLNVVTTFKASYFISLIISYITVLLGLIATITKQSLFGIFATIPLLINIISLLVNRKDVYMKFLLERYLYNFKFKRYKYIRGVDKMKRDYKHYFIINECVIEEKTYLNNYFKIVK